MDGGLKEGDLSKDYYTVKTYHKPLKINNKQANHLNFKNVWKKKNLIRTTLL